MPNDAEIDANEVMVERAFSREFLCIRVTPSSWDDRNAVAFAGVLAGDLGDHADWKAPEGWKMPEDWKMPEGWKSPRTRRSP